jgi:hypothetical protein
MALSMSALEATLDWIQSYKEHFFCFMGDGIEAVQSDDKRFQWDMTNPAYFIPLQQKDAMIDLYKPIAKRGLAWLGGNHEFKLQRFGDLAAEAAKGLGIPYGGCACKLLLEDRHGPIAKLYLCHPNRITIRSAAKDWEQRQANMMAAVKRFLVDKASDCVVMALPHTHKLIVVEPSKKLVIYDDGARLRQAYLEGDNSMPRYIDPDQRWYVNTGSYLRTMILDHDGYPERSGYDPVEIGHAVIEIRDRKVVAVRKVTIEA